MSGGPARSRVVILLALVLALDSADIATIGAVAGKLEAALRISNFQLGLLASLPSALIALATLPTGLLTDRVRRVPLLTGGIVLWSVAQAFSGASSSFTMLLLLRLILGLGSTPTGPTISSLVGDYIPARDRGYVWGLILSGELLGAGFGFLISGELASLLSWHWSFYALSVPGLVVAAALWRWLPEPARGGRSRLQEGETELVPPEEDESEPQDGDEFERSEAQAKVEQERVPADEQLVLHEDPAPMSLWRASIYVLRVRTNLVLMVASALGYFYFTGVQTFAVVLVRGQFHLSHGTAVLVVSGIGLGALVGVVLGGSLADWRLHRGHVNSRITIGGAAFVAAALLFLPGLLTYRLVISLPFFVLAGIAFAARNAPLDAARLDVMHHRLWGRAEAVRTLMRRAMVATAPVVFGALADSLGGRRSGVHGEYGFAATATAHGLHVTFLVFLVMLAGGGLLTFIALRTYPRDVSTAVASEEATSRAAN
jgi:MFS family permease